MYLRKKHNSLGMYECNAASCFENNFQSQIYYKFKSINDNFEFMQLLEVLQ